MTQPRPFDQITAVVLAGGQASRMGGVNKPLLEVGGRPILFRVVDTVLPLFGDVIVAEGREGSSPRIPGVRTVPDSTLGDGPIAGILAGLEGSATEWIFVVAGDMPWLDRKLIERVAAEAATAPPAIEAVVPAHKGLLEPTHALYRKTLIPAIEGMLERRKRCPLDLFDDHNTILLELSTAELQHMSNINTPEQLREAQEKRFPGQDR